MKDKKSDFIIIKVMIVILTVSIVVGCFTLKSDKAKNPENSTETVSRSEQSSKTTGETQKTEKSDKNKTSAVTSTSKSTDAITTTTKNAKSDVEVKNGISYVKGIMIVNKSYALPSDYAPGLNSEAENAFYEMKSAASEDGVSLWIVSDFRSYETQERIYNGYVADDGKAAADRYSARPGHSEHQTGLAMDLNSLSSSFGQTAEGKWLAENCWKYGFIIRFPEGKESITGYMYEPWHVRYLGKDTAKAVYDSGLTLEEYLGVDSVYGN